MELRAHEQLAPFLDHGEAWPRSAAALVLRNLFLQHDGARRSWLSAHGVTGFTRLLDEQDPNILSDAVLNLIDLLESDPELKHALPGSVPARLQDLHQEHRQDVDLAQSLEDLLALLPG